MSSLQIFFTRPPRAVRRHPALIPTPLYHPVGTWTGEISNCVCCRCRSMNGVRIFHPAWFLFMCWRHPPCKRYRRLWMRSLLKVNYQKQKRFYGFPRFLQTGEPAMAPCVKRFACALPESCSRESSNVFCPVAMSSRKGKTESICKRFKLPCAIQCGV